MVHTVVSPPGRDLRESHSWEGTPRDRATSARRVRHRDTGRAPAGSRRADALGLVGTPLLVLLSFLAVGLAGGLLLGGRLAALGEVRFHWQALAIGGLLFQFALFSAPVAGVVGAAGPPLYVGSTLVVLAALLRNVEQAWFRLIAFGASLNLVAIVANGGVMPADPAALAAAGLAAVPGTFSNTAPVAAAPFGFLGDLWATPAWLPFRNVVSVGDLLIGGGAAAWLLTVMLLPGAAAGRTDLNGQTHVRRVRAGYRARSLKRAV